MLLVPDDDALRLQIPDDVCVRFEDDVLPGVVWHLVGESAGIVDRHDGRDAGRLRGFEVVLTETGCKVNNAGAFFGSDERIGDDNEGIQHARSTDTAADARPANLAPLTMPTSWKPARSCL